MTAYYNTIDLGTGELNINNEFFAQSRHGDEYGASIPIILARLQVH